MFAPGAKIAGVHVGYELKYHLLIHSLLGFIGKLTIPLVGL